MPSTTAPLDALVVAPHPDDAELGMAGAILRMKAAGWRVGVLDLTDGEPTPRGTRAIRAAETAVATEILKLDWRGNLGLENRSLEPTLEARRKLAGALRQLRPRWLFAPYWVDAHPDHVAATQLVDAARFWAKLSKSDLPGQPFHPARVIHYFCVHLRLAIEPAFILDISPYWEKKRAAIECYQSQFAGIEINGVGFIERWREWSASWGLLIGARYGEPFASREPIGVTGFSELC